MTTATLNPTATLDHKVTDVAQTTRNILSWITATWANYREYHRAVAELNACSDRTLHDLGIYRGDIPHLAREAIRDQ